MRYLIDTTTLIDFSKGREPVTSSLLKIIQEKEELGICAVNVAEFYSGILIGDKSDLDKFISSLQYWDIKKDTAFIAGTLRYKNARKGKTISVADALIAAVTIQEGAVLVTDNKDDFPKDMKILSLRNT